MIRAALATRAARKRIAESGAWNLRTLWQNPGVDLPYDMQGTPGMPGLTALRVRCTAPMVPVTWPSSANLVSSLGHDGKHRPVFDLDWPSRLTPSTRPGHYHLAIDRPMSFWRMIAMLTGMWIAGVIEGTFLLTTIWRGMACIRAPWVKKNMVEGDRSAAWQK